MPLMDGDIVFHGATNRQVAKPGTRQFMWVKELRFEVRGNEEIIQIPLEQYTAEIGKQAMLYAAAQLIDLYDQFPRRG